MTFRWLKRNRSKGQTAQTPTHQASKPGADDLLKEATAMKQRGDVDGAIQCLRAAYRDIAAGNIEYPVSTFLRLPMYLHAGGYREEAWREFNRLIEQGYPNQPEDPDLIPFDRCAIYDKMRLCFQREKRAREAVKFGVLSDVCRKVGLNRQGRGVGHDSGDLDDMLMPLLERAGAEDLLGELSPAVAKHVERLSRVNLSHLARDIDAILLRKCNGDT